MNNTGDTDQISAIKPKSIEIIKDSAARAEKDGKFTKAQFTTINDNNWFKLFTPTTNGGSQLSAPEAIQIIEAIAKADGSTGWATAKCTLAGWGIGYLPGEIAAEIAGGKALVTGSADAGGYAEKTKTGYTVTGKWLQVSNAADATAFVVRCVVAKGTEPVRDADNRLQYVSVVLGKEEVTILNAASAMGLQATGAHDIEAKNIKIPAAKAFTIAPDTAKAKARIYDFPYIQLVEALLAAAVAGMTARFLELYKESVNGLKTPSGALIAQENMVQDVLEKHTGKIEDARTKLFYAVEMAWDACNNRRPIKDTILYKVSSGAQDLTWKARECTDALFPFCGLAATDKNSELNRVWRDIHTAAQESLLVFGGM